MAKSFKVQVDVYKGLTIHSKDQTFSSDADFAEKLQAALPVWRQAGYRGLWLKVDLEHAGFVPQAAKLGFAFHHAQPDYVMMTLWLPEEEENSLPGYATHYVGVAGLVVDDAGQLLVVQEKFFKKPCWKLPGGLGEKGESLMETAKREVQEETGIETEFVSLLCFRHMHNFRFGNSDFYFVCVLRPLSHTIHRCEREIAECQWMDLDEYIRHPDVNETNRHIAQCYKDIQTNHGRSIVPADVINYSKDGYHKVYSVGPVPSMEPGDRPPPLPTKQPNSSLNGAVGKPDVGEIAEDK